MLLLTELAPSAPLKGSRVSRPSGPSDNCGGVDEVEFFGIELLEKASVAEIEAAAGLRVFAATLCAVVKTPAGGAALDRAAQIRDKIVRLRFPTAVTAAKGLLILDRRDRSRFLHGVDQ